MGFLEEDGPRSLDKSAIEAGNNRTPSVSGWKLTDAFENFHGEVRLALKVGLEYSKIHRAGLAHSQTECVWVLSWAAALFSVQINVEHQILLNLGKRPGKLVAIEQEVFAHFADTRFAAPDFLDDHALLSSIANIDLQIIRT